MSIDFKNIGQRVKNYRRRRHLRQDELAWDAELSVSYLSCIENGVKQASLSALVRIAEALNVTVDSLIYGEADFGADYMIQELYAVLKGCDVFEQKIIMDVMLGTAVAVKNSLRSSRVQF